MLWISSLFLLCFLLTTHGLVIPKTDDKSKRIYDNALSDEQHYGQDEEHNIDYDHEAFLGEREAKTFDELTPEESKLRLGKMVDKVDADKDGFVSLQELKEWIQFTQKRYIVDDAERQWKGLNPDNKPTLSWHKYKKVTYGYIEDDEHSSHYKDMLERDRRRWKVADKDGDDEMTKAEFVDFIHPEEAPHMQDIVVTETMEDIDKNKDGKVSIDEYIGDMYGEGEDNDDEEPDWVKTEREQFTQFRDKDRSGYLEFEEVKNWILPPDFDHSEAEARHLVYESDVNRDNLLTKEEILNKYDLFVGSQATDFGEALVRHDEF